MIKEIEEFLKNAKKVKQITLDETIEDRFKILAIVKYCKEKED